MKKLTLTFLPVFLLFMGISTTAQECGPMINEVYEFPVGSQFQYKTTLGGEYAYEDVKIETYTITNRWENGDTLFLVREGIIEYSVYNLGFERVLDSRETDYINDTMLIVNEPVRPMNYCEDQLVKIDEDLEYYSYVKVNNSLKIIGGEDNVYEYDENNNLIQIDNENSYNYHYENIVKEGVGLQKMSEGNVMAYTETVCEGYIIDGDTTGVFKNTSTAVPEITFDEDFKIYPNIIQADGRLNIETKRNIKSLNIVSLDGRVIREKLLNENYLLLGDIPKGLYFLTFNFDGYSITRKVFK